MAKNHSAEKNGASVIHRDLLWLWIPLAAFLCLTGWRYAHKDCVSEAITMTDGLSPLSPWFTRKPIDYRPTIVALKEMGGNPGKILVLGQNDTFGPDILNVMRMHQLRSFGLTTLWPEYKNYVQGEIRAYPFADKTFAIVYNAGLFREFIDLGLIGDLNRGIFLYELAAEIHRVMMDRGYLITKVPHEFGYVLRDIGFIQMPFHVNGKAVWAKRRDQYYHQRMRGLVETEKRLKEAA